MTIDEYRDKITGVIKNPETGGEVGAELIKSLTEDLSTMEAMKIQLSESEKKIRELQDSNVKLFLSVTGQSNQEEEEEEKPETIEEFAHRFREEAMKNE